MKRIVIMEWKVQGSIEMSEIVSAFLDQIMHVFRLTALPDNRYPLFDCKVFLDLNSSSGLCSLIELGYFSTENIRFKERVMSLAVIIKWRQQSSAIINNHQTKSSAIIIFLQ